MGSSIAALRLPISLAWCVWQSLLARVRAGLPQPPMEHTPMLAQRHSWLQYLLFPLPVGVPHTRQFVGSLRVGTRSLKPLPRTGSSIGSFVIPR